MRKSFLFNVLLKQQLNFEFGAESKGANGFKSCRSPQEFSNEDQYLLAKIGFGTAENGPLKVCQKLASSQKKTEHTQACLSTSCLREVPEPCMKRVAPSAGKTLSGLGRWCLVSIGVHLTQGFGGRWVGSRGRYATQGLQFPLSFGIDAEYRTLSRPIYFQRSGSTELAH